MQFLSFCWLQSLRCPLSDVFHCLERLVNGNLDGMLDVARVFDEPARTLKNTMLHSKPASSTAAEVARLDDLRHGAYLVLRLVVDCQWLVVDH